MLEYFELTAKIDIAILDGEHQYLKVKAEIHDATLILDPIFLAAKAFSLSSRFLSKIVVSDSSVILFCMCSL